MAIRFILLKGTRGKLIERVPGQIPTVKSWTLTKEFAFENCLIDPHVVVEMVRRAQFGAIQTGYALFGGDSGGDRHARFLFAVEYNKIFLDPNS